MFKKAFFAACLAFGMAKGASAATFHGEFWDASGSVSSLTTALSVMTGSPTATFESSAIDYPNGAQNFVGDSTTLASYLGVDSGTIVGSGTTNLFYSVFRFTGFLDLLPGSHTFAVGSDDGFRLTIDGNLISQFTGLRGFGTTTTTASVSGLLPFELIYFENSGGTGVEFFIDGALAQPAEAIAPVPLPAGGLLLLGALGALGLSRKRRAA